MRNYEDWIKAYCEYTSFTEAPPRMHFWVAASVIAGALRRHVWIDQVAFKWMCNLYVLIVAPPGVAAKSTTAAIGMDILREVPGIKFGPHIVSWPALVKAFAESSEMFGDIQGSMQTQCAMTIESSELGNLLNPNDRDMMDLLVTLWDAKQGAIEKVTKMFGSDKVENPWLNLIGCTTPAWVAGNFPEYTIEGGLTSRFILIYEERKHKFIAYPRLVVPPGHGDKRQKLIEDLTHIGTNLIGEYVMPKETTEWGDLWYEKHWKTKPKGLEDTRFEGYLARKQTQIHKVAMIIAASKRDDLVLLPGDLDDANQAVSGLEADMPTVFAKIGRTAESIQAEKFIKYVIKKGAVPLQEAYAYIYSAFPNAKNFDGIAQGAMNAGLVIYDKEKRVFHAPTLLVNPETVSPTI